MTPLLDQLASLDESVVAANTRARALGAEVAEHHASIEHLREERIAAYADDDERKATSLKKKTGDAEARARELAERQQGAEVAARRAQASRDAWIGENIRGLLSELEPEAQAATDAVVSSADDLARARKHWHEVRNRVAALLRHSPEFSAQAMPSIDQADNAIRDAHRAVQSLPQPFPQQRADAWSIAPTDDPDPEVREAARAKAINGAA